MPRYNIYVFLIILTLSFIYVPESHAKTDTIYASYKYTMGDNDTKNEAKLICFIKAKRRALEKAGVYIESITEINNLKLTKDEIKTYASAILKTEVVKEEVKFEGESVTIHTTVKVDVDDNSLFNKLEQIKTDSTLASKVKKQQNQIQQLEDKIETLQKQKENLDIQNTAKVKKEQYKTIQELDEVEKIQLEIKKITELEVDNVDIGMTYSEVIQVAGEPISKGYEGALNYGKAWVLFERGIVACIVHANNYKSSWRTCSYYQSPQRLK